MNFWFEINSYFYQNFVTIIKTKLCFSSTCTHFKGLPRHNKNYIWIWCVAIPWLNQRQCQSRNFLAKNDFSVAFCIAVCETQPSSPCRGLKDKIFFIYFLNVGKWEGGAWILKIISWFNGGAQARCIRKTSYYIIIRL